MTTYYCSGADIRSNQLFDDSSFDLDISLSDWVNSGTDSFTVIGNGTAVATNLTATAQLSQPNIVTANKWYYMECRLSSYSSGTLTLVIADVPVSDLSIGGGNFSPGTTIASALVKAPSSTGQTGVRLTSGGNATITDFTLYEMQTSGDGLPGTEWQGLLSVDSSVLIPGDIVEFNGTFGPVDHLIINGIDGTSAQKIVFDATNAYINIENTLSRDIIYIDNCDYLQLNNFNINSSRLNFGAVGSATLQNRIITSTTLRYSSFNNCVLNNACDIGIAIELGCLEVDVINCRVSNGLHTGIYNNSYGGTVIGNYIYNNGLSGITSDGGAIGTQNSNITIANNYCIENGNSNADSDFEISCFSAGLEGPVYIYNNYIKNAYQGGIQLAGGTNKGHPNSIIRNNIIDGYNTSTQTGGITTAKYSAIRIGFGSSGTGPVSYDFSGIKIYNNTILNNGASHTSSAGLSFGLSLDCDYSNLEVKNNIFSNNINAIFIQQGSNGAQNNIDINNNIYYSIDYTNSWNTYDSLSAWQSASGFDLNSYTIDPKLNLDYSLQIDSPCISAGAPILDSRDYNGNYKASILDDIGAIWFNNIEDSTVNILLGSGYRK